MEGIIMSCNDQSCSEEHHHHHHHEHSCECECSCHDCPCCGEEEEGDCADRSHQLLALANVAWMEVLKEKIKDHIRQSDSKIDEIARIVSEANRDYWHGKMAETKAKENYEKKLSELFDQSSEQCKSIDHKNKGSNK
jgi:hypothetical protein